MLPVRANDDRRAVHGTIGGNKLLETDNKKVKAEVETVCDVRQYGNEATLQGSVSQRGLDAGKPVRKTPTIAASRHHFTSPLLPRAVDSIASVSPCLRMSR